MTVELEETYISEGKLLGRSSSSASSCSRAGKVNYLVDDGSRKCIEVTL